MTPSWCDLVCISHPLAFLPIQLYLAIVQKPVSKWIMLAKLCRCLYCRLINIIPAVERVYQYFEHWCTWSKIAAMNQLPLGYNSTSVIWLVHTHSTLMRCEPSGVAHINNWLLFAVTDLFNHLCKVMFLTEILQQSLHVHEQCLKLSHPTAKWCFFYELFANLCAGAGLKKVPVLMELHLC